jgi:hypothetical protein
MKHLISADAKLKITAVNRETKKEHETIMTYSEWVKLKKSFDYDWKAVAL